MRCSPHDSPPRPSNLTSRRHHAERQTRRVSEEPLADGETHEYRGDSRRGTNPKSVLQEREASCVGRAGALFLCALRPARSWYPGNICQTDRQTR